MSSEKDLAIVLRVVDFSETSLVVTLFTENFGKVSALAKGARRPKSPFEAALDLLSLCRIVFIHKSSDALDLLTEARLERRFRAGARDLSRLYAGYYVAELLQALTDEGDPHPELFALAEQTLSGLEREQPTAPLVLRFEMAALNLLGHLPSLADCVECGRRVEGGDRVAFGLLAGGALCGACRVGRRQVISVSRPVLDALQSYSDVNSDQWRGQMESAEGGELRSVVNRYLAHQLGREPRMRAYLGMLAT